VDLTRRWDRGNAFDDYPLLPNSLAVVPSGCVLEDVKRNYGEEPTEVVTIGIDSNDTKARAESYMGAIVFRKP
jgi:hypothetical protein